MSDPNIKELEQLRAQAALNAPIVAAAHEWWCEREVKDWSEADLAKALMTATGDWPGCDECDHRCDEPCMPHTVAEYHHSIDCQIAQLCHDGKLPSPVDYKTPEGWTPVITNKRGRVL